MREMIDRTKVRIKKQFWLLLLIPILTGAVSYYMAAKEPVVSTANVEIVLGNFQDSILTNDKLMAEKLKTEKYLQELTSTDENYSGMAVELKEGKILSLTLSGDDEAEVEDHLNLIVDSLMEESRSVFEQKEDMLKKQITDMEEHNPGAESLPPLTDELLNLRETGIHQELVVTTTDGGTAKRGIFGVIVGLMLAAFLLVLPEIFRD